MGVNVSILTITTIMETRKYSSFFVLVAAMKLVLGYGTGYAPQQVALPVDSSYAEGLYQSPRSQSNSTMFSILSCTVSILYPVLQLQSDELHRGPGQHVHDRVQGGVRPEVQQGLLRTSQHRL